MHNWSWRSVYSSRAVLHIVSVRYGKVFLHVVCYKLSGVANAPVIFFYFILFIFLSGNFQWVRATHASSGHSGDSCVSLRISGPIKTCSSLLCPVIARTPLFFCETIEVISLQCIIDRRPSKINKQKSSNLFAIPWGGFALRTRFGDDGRSSQTHRPTTRSEQRSSGERGPFYPQALCEGPVTDERLFFDLTWWIFLTTRQRRSQAAQWRWRWPSGRVGEEPNAVFFVFF